MHHCDTLAIKVSEVLRGTTERIAMQWSYAVQSHLLGFVERTQGRATSKEIANLVAAQERELIQIEKYYSRAGEKAARIVYFWGMIVGAVISGPATNCQKDPESSESSSRADSSQPARRSRKSITPIGIPLRKSARGALQSARAARQSRSTITS